MMFNKKNKLARIAGFSLSALGLLLAGANAQTEPDAGENAALPAIEETQPQPRPGSSFQPGAAYKSQPPVASRAVVDKVERAKQQERKLRRMMASFGVTELDIQNAIIVYVQDEVQRRQPLREQVNKLYGALQNETINITGMASLLTDYRAAVEADKERRMAAEAALNTQIGFTTNPRLEAMLLLFGVIGDAPTVMMMPRPYAAPPSRAALASNPTERPAGPAGPNGEPAASAGAERNPSEPVEPNRPPNLLTENNDGLQGELGYTELQRIALFEQFDFNRDGELDDAERNEARDFLARDYLSRRLWPPKENALALKRNAASGRNETSKPNSETAREGGNTGAVSPETPQVPRVLGPLPVIPAQALTQAAPPPAN